MKKSSLILLVLAIFFRLEAYGAMGVSERSVKGWDNEKLCKRSGELELAEDWKAVAIITKEISRRPDLSIDTCNELADSKMVEKTKSVRKASTKKLPAKTLEKYEEAKIKGLEKYGGAIYSDLLLVICEKKETDVALFENYRNFVVANIPNRYASVRHIVGNDIMNQIQGIRLGLGIAKNVSPNLCSDQGISLLDKAFQQYVDLRLQEQYTQQQLSTKFQVGQALKEVSSIMGEAALTEDKGEILALHYCKTQEYNEYLVLYFFKESLLYEHRYIENKNILDEDGDCSKHTGKGSYEVPEAIKLISASASQ